MVCVTVVCLLLLAWYVLTPHLRRLVQTRAEEALRYEFASDVQFQSFDVALFPRVHAIARGVTIGNDHTRPVIQIAVAEGRSGWVPWHIRTMVLEGLSVRIPASYVAVQQPKPAWIVSVEEGIAESAHFEIEPDSIQSTAIHFELAHLRVKNYHPGQAAEFTASVISSQPHAEVQVSGHLGRWNGEHPNQTALEGAYRMPTCDLAQLPGLKGALSSHGQFQGVLRRIELSGDAEAPQFALSVSGRPEQFRAKFQATVDASDGSASIGHIHGMLESSPFSASGRISNVQSDNNRDIMLDVSIDKGRLEDVLPLAVRSKTSPISGALRLRSKLEILPGGQDVLNRLRLDSDFNASTAQFSSWDVREQVRSVSRKASGRPKEKASGSSESSMQGHVQVRSGSVQFTNLVFDLEDASAVLHGWYQLASGQLDLHGQLWMAVKLSRTATGMKAFFLKAADPFFRGKNGGSLVPIKITGTRQNPEFGLDLANKK